MTTEVAASPSLLLGSVLEHGDVVSISPLLPEHLYDISEIRIKLLGEPVDRKGKKRASQDIVDIDDLVKQTLRGWQTTSLLSPIADGVPALPSRSRPGLCITGTDFRNPTPIRWY